ncbi:MAG: hypothetical protein V3T84_11650 [Phycisphaerales bacterium]
MRWIVSTARVISEFNRPGPRIAAMTGVAILGLLGAARFADGGDFPACNEEAGTCFEPNDTPGCAISECCNLVCDVDAFCCFVIWDTPCADAAQQLCPACPGKGPCFEPNDTPGCEDGACCEIVCSIDSFCCAVVWDQICVDEALVVCGTEPCELTCPDGATPEPDACGENTNGGCLQDPAQFTPITCGETVCGTVWATGNRDTDWYELTVAETTLLTWTISSEFPAAGLIISGECEFGFQIVAEAYAVGCAPASAELCVDPGTYFLFIAPGTEAGPILEGIPCTDKGKGGDLGFFGNDYVATIQCEQCQRDCPADLNGDGSVGAADLLSLLVSWGPCKGCPADFDGDGTVGASDLLTLLVNWGPCP